MSVKPALKVCIIGAGGRGSLFATLIQQSHPLAEVWGLAEPDAARRAVLAAQLKLPLERQFDSWENLIKQPKAWDAVVICTMDRDHVKPALAFMNQGCHVLLEKPMATTLEDCRALAAAEAKSDGVVAICHSLRSNKGFTMLRDLVHSGAIGRLVSLDQIEQIAYWHFAHSYVRGKWAQEKESTFMLMAKSCHDLDYMSYLVGQPCLRVASFGSLSYFKPEFAPPGSTPRCTDGCKVEADCSYSARKVYVESGIFPDWLSSNATQSMNQSERLKFIQTSPYGRCVWDSDNDVVDHQVVALEYLGGITATFTTTAFTKDCARRLRVHGTEGEIHFNEEEEFITLKHFQNKKDEVINFGAEAGAHGGGDQRLATDWLLAARGEKNGVAASVSEALKTHTIVFAAERSRREKRMVSLAEMDEI